MAYDPTQPTNSTKIRDLSNVIVPNWVAIEQAESTFKPIALNLDNRTIATIPINPVALANAYIIFSKEGTVGTSEFYGIDPASNIIQFSQAGKMGSSTTNLAISSITYGSDTFSYGLGSIIKARGSVSTGGVISANLNMTAVRNFLGNYTVSVSADILSPASGYQIFITLLQTANQALFRTVTKAVPVAGNPTAITFQVIRTDNSAGLDCAFDIMVIGGV